MFHEQPNLLPSTARSASRNPRNYQHQLEPLCAVVISSCLVSKVLSADKDKEIHWRLRCRGSCTPREKFQQQRKLAAAWLGAAKAKAVGNNRDFCRELELWNLFQPSPLQEYRQNYFVFCQLGLHFLTGEVHLLCFATKSLATSLF